MTGPLSDLPVEHTRDGAVLRIRVTPKARRPGVLGIRGGYLAVAVAAAPEKGRATAEAVERVAAWLGLKTAGLRPTAGATSRDKRFLVADCTAADLRKRVEAAVSGRPPRVG